MNRSDLHARLLEIPEGWTPTLIRGAELHVRRSRTADRWSVWGIGQCTCSAPAYPDLRLADAEATIMRLRPERFETSPDAPEPA